MTAKVRITGGSNPLLIDSVNADGDFINLLFTSDYRSLRWWMKGAVSAPANSNWQGIGSGSVGVTDGYVVVGLGKTFSSAPLVGGRQAGSALLSCFVGATTAVGQSGGFLISLPTQLYCCNLGGGSLLIEYYVLDMGANG